MNTPRVGMEYVIIGQEASDPFFPHDFVVTDETEKLIHVRNRLETYWTTRIRFETSEGTAFRKKTS